MTFQDQWAPCEQYIYHTYRIVLYMWIYIAQLSRSLYCAENASS